MKVAVPREIKNNEHRVALTPAGVHELVAAGHDVAIETGAGLGSAISDSDYREAGALVCPDADTTWGAGDLVLKVKEPIQGEFHRMRPGQTLFTYLHLAASPECTEALLEHHVTGIAYETVQTADGRLPLLAPMSEVAGRLAVQAGAYCLQRPEGGRGTLMGGVPGTAPARVVIIGAGVSGMNAAAIAVGMRADVELLDLNVDKLHLADNLYQGRLRTIVSSRFEIKRACREADLVIGAVLVPGAKAPTVVDDDVLADMKEGAVLVDIAIDQGGCFAHSKPTTHDSPTFTHAGKLFYCVANMPGAVPNTSTYALTNATLPYVMKLANLGWKDALKADRALALGLNTHEGQVVNEPVAITHHLPLKSIEQVLAKNLRPFSAHARPGLSSTRPMSPTRRSQRRTRATSLGIHSGVVDISSPSTHSGRSHAGCLGVSQAVDSLDTLTYSRYDRQWTVRRPAPGVDLAPGGGNEQCGQQRQMGGPARCRADASR